ncbi:MAG: hypothetical protein ACTTKL_07940 [Treponema sp.]
MSTRKKNEGAADTASAQNELEQMASGGAAENGNTETSAADTPPENIDTAAENGNETTGDADTKENTGTADGGNADAPQTGEADSADEVPKSSAMPETPPYLGATEWPDVPETPFAEYEELPDESANMPPMNVTRYIRLKDISGGQAAILKNKYAMEMHTLREWDDLFEAEMQRKVTS